MTASVVVTSSSAESLMAAPLIWPSVGLRRFPFSPRRQRMAVFLVALIRPAPVEEPSLDAARRTVGIAVAVDGPEGRDHARDERLALAQP